MSPSATPHMVALPNSIHQLPTGSRAIRRTNGQRWIELTLGVKRSADLPDLSGARQQASQGAQLHDAGTAARPVRLRSRGGAVD